MNTIDNFIKQHREFFDNKKEEYRSLSYKVESKKEYLNNLEKYDEKYLQSQLSELSTKRKIELLDVQTMLQKVAISKPNSFKALHDGANFSFRMETMSFNGAIFELENFYGFRVGYNSYGHSTKDISLDYVIENMLMLSKTVERVEEFMKQCKDRNIVHDMWYGVIKRNVSIVYDAYWERNEQNRQDDKAENIKIIKEEVTELKQKLAINQKEQEKINQLMNVGCEELVRHNKKKQELVSLNNALQKMGFFQFSDKKKTAQRIGDLEKEIAIEKTSVDQAQNNYLNELKEKMSPVVNEISALESQIMEKEKEIKQLVYEKYLYKDICNQYNEFFETFLTFDQIEKKVERLFDIITERINPMSEYDVAESNLIKL